MNFRADLHCHTHCSDGTLSPGELVRRAKQLGLSGLSITDHDTIAAYQEAIPVAKEEGVELITGVELSVMQGDVSVHILGYAFDLESPVMREFCECHVRWRLERNREILQRLTDRGMALSEEELIDFCREQGFPDLVVYGRPHIALALMAKGYISDVQQAFREFIGDGCSCYVPGQHATVQEGIDAIHASGGLAVIAHPHLLQRSSVLSEVLALNFDGIEGPYGNRPSHSQKRWIKEGQKRGWLVTGGSDFHGSVKPHIELGQSFVGEETFRRLQEHSS